MESYDSQWSDFYLVYLKYFKFNSEHRKSPAEVRIGDVVHAGIRLQATVFFVQFTRSLRFHREQSRTHFYQNELSHVPIFFLLSYNCFVLFN